MQSGRLCALSRILDLSSSSNKATDDVVVARVPQGAIILTKFEPEALVLLHVFVRTAAALSTRSYSEAH